MTLSDVVRFALGAAGANLAEVLGRLSLVVREGKAWLSGSYSVLLEIAAAVGYYGGLVVRWRPRLAKSLKLGSGSVGVWVIGVVVLQTLLTRFRRWVAASGGVAFSDVDHRGACVTVQPPVVGVAALTHLPCGGGACNYDSELVMYLRLHTAFQPRSLALLRTLPGRCRIWARECHKSMVCVEKVMWRSIALALSVTPEESRALAYLGEDLQWEGISALSSTGFLLGSSPTWWDVLTLRCSLWDWASSRTPRRLSG